MAIVVGGYLGFHKFNSSSKYANLYYTHDLHPNSKASAVVGLSNPASVNCTEQGGQLVMKTRGDGGQYGLCQFGDNQACEEWALDRGECPKGGVKTTGYDNIQQSYCAWIGGQTLAEKAAKCTLPSGQVCGVDALYNGKCS